ncbi:hypothetical protein [Salipiger marinus]|uniref:Serine dehydrogenase proteinase n=1 Tax=Salipiger marinus TaxID=555512 RepID=A0A1G8V7A6_9RHOB|nr:hypothetical protein [Salipiger marinus]SDJ61958.1 hypothetical protein SAMN04487993_10733 [Salipiger marinus]
MDTRKDVPCIFVHCCSAILGVLPASLLAMNFSIERLDLRPIRQPTLHVTATGEILPGDTEKLKVAFDAIDKTGVRDVLLMFDSPGGSLMESLEMGAYIADIPACVRRAKLALTHIV